MPGNSNPSGHSRVNDQLLVPHQFLHVLGIGRRQVVRKALGEFRDGQPAAHHFLGRPPLGHPRHRAEHEVEVVAQFGPDFSSVGGVEGCVVAINVEPSARRSHRPMPQWRVGPKCPSRTAEVASVCGTTVLVPGKVWRIWEPTGRSQNDLRRVCRSEGTLCHVNRRATLWRGRGLCQKPRLPVSVRQIHTCQVVLG